MDVPAAEKALHAGCHELRLPETAAKELLRFLIVKRLVGDDKSSRLSPSSKLDRLLHWVLLNTAVRDHVEEHVGRVFHTTATAQQADAQKMERRLVSMECMAKEGWQPTLSLWEDPASLLSRLAPVEVRLAGSPGTIIKYCCMGKPPTAIMTQLKQQGVAVHSYNFQEVRDVAQPARAFRSSLATKRKAPMESVLSSAAGQEESLEVIIADAEGNKTNSKLRRTTKLEKVAAAYAAHRKVDPKSFKLVYDGTRLEPDLTPAYYRMESGDVVYVVKEQAGC
ncbi:hypothetical protein WJX73_007416 [Symbiochloris irregularis]|uniref:Ubiquitin-like domain-containing protein n=1 Tax=Symbiochloris irregularis TaxID=706552 RepID=A0AAW1NK76_9CHLO